MLVLPRDLYQRVVGHCIDGYPLEACGLLGGRLEQDDAVVAGCYPARNSEQSACVYTVEPRDLLAADRAAEAAGGQLVGVYHSHTHTEAKPSQTDASQAPDPDWHYVIVSLRDAHPTLRSWRIVDGKISEEPVVLE